jgi:hypothetical protein
MPFMNVKADLLYRPFVFLLFLGLVPAEMKSGDTLVIHPITFETPSPEGWNAPYRVTVSFPSENTTWNKIWLVQTLKCDPSTRGDKYDCGEWDYIWDVLLHVPAGDSTEVFKLGSYVTPYGKRLYLGGDKGWTWTYDITDYTPLLKGDLDLTMGNNQELLDLKFLFIAGTPVRDVLTVENVYSPGKLDEHYSYMYRYSALAGDSVLQAKELILRPDAAGYRLKAIISGHGHEGPDNCCEWTDKWHAYWLNGNKTFTWNIWKDCGNNAVYPQGGTWPYDRAGWCPGTKVDEYSFEITDLVEPGATVTINYEIEPPVDKRENLGIYRMAHQLFSYGPPHFSVNAELKEVINPSSEDNYSRINPTLFEPRILVQNSGSDVIRNMRITYGMLDGVQSTYRWRGLLVFLEQTEIALPVPDWSGLNQDQTFVVEIAAVNGMRDDYPQDSRRTTRVQIPAVLPEAFTIYLQTNNFGRARENTLSIRNQADSTVLKMDNLEDDQLYKIPVQLDTGFYELLFSDQEEDGIDRLWWKSNKDSVGSSGKLQLLGIYDTVLVEFPPDFGQEIRYPFLIGQVP